MTRVSQFANDLGISREQAKKLINKGRAKKDGGSNILENFKMKAKKSNKTKAKKISMDAGPANTLEDLFNKYIRMGLSDEEAEKKAREEIDKLPEKDAKARKAESLNEAIKKVKMGKKNGGMSENRFMQDDIKKMENGGMVRGMGAAISPRKIQIK